MEQLVQCPSCQWENGAGSNFCGRCGRQLGTPAAATMAIPGPGQAGAPTSIRGIVRSFQQRQEKAAVQPKNGPPIISVIWNFRIEIHDAYGNPLRPIPVVMRGLSFSGTVNDGDEVEIGATGVRDGGTVRVDELMNHTTGTVVRVQSVRAAIRRFFGAGTGPGSPSTSNTNAHNITVEGVIRGFQQSEEQAFVRLFKLNTDRHIWQFRLDRYDAAGNALAPVAVELRGWSFSGMLTEGDHVVVHGDVRDGTLRTTAARNLTTGANIQATSYTIVLRLIALAIPLFFIVMALTH